MLIPTSLLSSMHRLFRVSTSMRFGALTRTIFGFDEAFVTLSTLAEVNLQGSTTLISASGPLGALFVIYETLKMTVQ